MYNFTDLIARSYLEYTEECEDNIAVFFFQQYHQVRYENKFIFTKNLFYKKLIEHLEHLIDCTYHNTHFKDENYSGFEDAESVAFENYQIERLENHQKLLNDVWGIDHKVTRVDYERSNNANELREAFANGLDLIDPINIISPSKDIQADDLVLRKSNLEYLKSEAIRAREANNIEELNEETRLNKNHQLKEGITSENDLINIEEVVRKHFKFTLEVNDRKKKQMLSEEEFLKLVRWVTYFLGNKYELPIIDNPIMKVHIGKTKIKSAFKNLMHLYHPKRPKPKSFYTLVSICFYALKDETEYSIQRTSDPDKPVN